MRHVGGDDLRTLVRREGRLAPERAARVVAQVGSALDAAHIGDSHASHWRAALEGVAKARGWHGVSITHSGCPFTRAVKDLREPARSDCLRWNREVREWLGRHREISTVFASAISGSSWVVPRGRSQYGSAVDGYLRAFKSLPRSVENVVVIRDTPKAERDTAACVQRSIGAHRRAGTACAQPRLPGTDRRPARGRRHEVEARPRPPRRPHALHLRRPAVLPGRRRRPRLQGRAPSDHGLRDGP